MVVKNDVKKIEQIEAENDDLLDQFIIWLSDKFSSEEECDECFWEVDDYVSGFLMDEQAIKACDGWKEIDRFFMNWFVCDELERIGKAADGIYKFYKFLHEKKMVSKDDLNKIGKIIDENMPKWLEKSGQFLHDFEYAEQSSIIGLAESFYYSFSKKIINIIRSITNSDEEEDHIVFLAELIVSTERLLPERNEECYCGSGKKYKKCCLENSADELNDLEDPRYHEGEEIFNEIADCDGIDESSELENEICVKHRNKLLNDHETVCDDDIPILKNLCEKHPCQPEISNDLFYTYRVMEKNEEFRECLEELFIKTPENLLARINLAHIYLMIDQDVQKAEKLLEGKVSLKEFYPHRKKFHLLEYVSLEIMLIHLAISKGKLALAGFLFSNLIEMVDYFGRADDFAIIEVRDRFMSAKIARKLAILLNRENKSEK